MAAPVSHFLHTSAPFTHSRLALLPLVFCFVGGHTCQQVGASSPVHQENLMLHYAVVFFVIALIAAVFGFGGIAAGAIEIGKILFMIFAVLAVISFLVSLVKKN
jgi:uncharacterized membrane protein YtjA (UPF0391 family)